MKDDKKTSDALHRLHLAAIAYGRAVDYKAGGDELQRKIETLKSASRVYRWRFEGCQVHPALLARHEQTAERS